MTGASRGLGLEIVRQEVSAGNSVVAISRHVGEALNGLINESNGAIRHVSCDLSSPEEEVQKILKEQISSDCIVHGLVNNAAVAYDDLASNLDMERLSRMFHVNVLMPMLLTKFVLRRMLLHDVAGSIVHVSSVCAHTGYKGLSMYAASKGALEAFSRNIAREWGAKGIRSNCVVPGFMETDMSSSLETEQKDRIYRRTSLKKATSVKSVAAVVGLLLSQASDSVTGQNYHVDAGT